MPEREREPMDVDLAGLMVFRDLAETRNFSETGRRMGISQPAVSLTISQLEGAVGLVLLERHSSGARLTPAGVAFRERANEVCDAFLCFTDGICGLGRQLDKEVWIGVDGSSLANRLSDGLCEALREKGMKVVCGSVADRWDEDLESGRVDVVIASRFLQAGMTAGIQEAEIKTERGITVAWHPSFYPFDRDRFNFPEVLRTTLLVPDSKVARGFGEFLKQWCDHAYGMQGANTVVFGSEVEAARAADAGLGVLLAPGNVMDRLDGLPHELDFVRTFEFLLPEAYRVGVYCRADERAREVLNVAAHLVK